MSNEKRLDQRQRLLAIREYLRVRSMPGQSDFVSDVVAACLEKAQPVLSASTGRTGEEILAALAADLGVRFEEVRSQADVDQLEQKYLVEKKEIGFGLLAKELANPSVDALLFQRLKAATDDPDRWVAVINLQRAPARAYWSKAHEIVHRLAEPPQRRLPFYRHRADSETQVERLIDLGAAELAFPQSAFGPRVQKVRNDPLTWDLVHEVSRGFAPTASLLAGAKALVRHWPAPAFLLTGQVRGTTRQPQARVALRIDIEGFSAAAEGHQVRFFHNMRVPKSSPMYEAHALKRQLTDYEDLGRWETSGGSRLPSCKALTSAMSLGDVCYALVTLDT